MIKKVISLIFSLLFIFSFVSCSDDVAIKTGWQNPDIDNATKEETTQEEETTKTDTATDIEDTPEIKFSETKALFIGNLNSKIYGKMSVYHQEGYFLIRDEYDETKFTIFAENYSSSATDNIPISLFSDMNFDGHEDFGVCYYKDSLNSYYFCFLWNTSEKSYTYTLAYSSIANPVFDSDKQQIVSTYKFTVTTVREDIYVLNGTQLKLTTSQEKEIAPETDTGPEVLDAEIGVLENSNSALITLRTNTDSQSKWVCHIENESIVTLSSEFFDESEFAYEFLLTSVAPGATTVIFRFERVDTHEYAEERIINIIVQDNGDVKVVIPQEAPQESTPQEIEPIS